MSDDRADPRLDVDGRVEVGAAKHHRPGPWYVLPVQRLKRARERFELRYGNGRRAEARRREHADERRLLDGRSDRRDLAGDV